MPSIRVRMLPGKLRSPTSAYHRPSACGTWQRASNHTFHKVGRSCIGNRTNAIRSGGRIGDSTSEFVRWGARCRNDGNAGEGEGDELEELHCWY